METLETSVRPAVELAEVAERQASEQKRETFDTMQKGCDPLFQLFHKFSSDEHKPGDLVEKKFLKVEAELSQLASQIATEKRSGSGTSPVGVDLSPSSLQGNAFGLSGTLGSFPGNVVSPPRGFEPGARGGSAEMSREAEARFNVLESQLLELKDQCSDQDRRLETQLSELKDHLQAKLIKLG